MSNYDDEQSEDGELAQSPIQDEMDFSLSDDDHGHDALEIKPPQAIIHSSHRKGHKRSGKDRHKESSHKEKKHAYHDKEKMEKVKSSKNGDELYYREKQYYREAYRDKDVYRDKDIYREKELTRDRDVYREREHYRERDPYREGGSYKEHTKIRDHYREKDNQREREIFSSRERMRYVDADRKADRIESRLRVIADDGQSVLNEKENKTSGDKELEDLRSRLLNKRISKELHEAKRQIDYGDRNNKSDRHYILDKTQQERRKRLIEAEREIEKRKHESRTELEARREERRRRGKKRSITPDNETVHKRNKNASPEFEDNFVTVSDTSDVDIKSDHSDHQEGISKSESDSEESSTESESVVSKTDDEERDEDEHEHEPEDETDEEEDARKVNDKSKSPEESLQRSLIESPKSHSRSKSRSRSRSHSFSPQPPGENGKVDTGTDNSNVKDEEESKILEEKIKLLPPYFPALQGCRSVEEFHCLNRIEEGTYGVVYRARDRTTEEIVALKRLKMEKEKEGFPITSLREINTLLKAQNLLPEEVIVLEV